MVAADALNGEHGYEERIGCTHVATYAPAFDAWAVGVFMVGELRPLFLHYVMEKENET